MGALYDKVDDIRGSRGMPHIRAVRNPPGKSLPCVVANSSLCWAAGRRAAEATAESKQPQGLVNIFEGISRPALPMPGSLKTSTRHAMDRAGIRSLASLAVARTASGVVGMPQAVNR